MENKESIKIGSSPLDFMNEITYGNLALHTTIDGGLGSGKTGLALEILRQHHGNGGGFCYFSPREDLAVLDAVHEIDAKLIVRRQITDTGTLHGETTEAVTAFINGGNNLFITRAGFSSGPSSPSAVLEAMSKSAQETRQKDRNDVPRILVIDDANFVSDASMGKLLAIARRAHVAVITVFNYAIQHPATVAQSNVRILMGGLDHESVAMWQKLTGISIAPYTIPIGQAWVLLPDSDVPAIHEVWNGSRTGKIKAGHMELPN
ncbi:MULTISPECIES: ATP-binding protein [Acidithiobacillus]|uniref:Uncharacterized protein n=2 Tax=Acidithiobacillus TaxID=119977 RepID=A0A179BPV0_ACIFR|nr:MULTISPECIES: ATP-binding protein [Acidithiobacillus]MEB8488156.1 ATP-binding protein [Acidithiobacillus ferriphilus]MEB8488742.1 ATP-binding protein [Acidithiobacillus ferriphilus]MEB8492186.1 ATP-binding protein [Acidithiobacillus ferriphilus]MEB8513490.1 ATP-binding protein [Acidithiobacillus ferriphilus]MEB8533260.1 ATP-binding protein [Acidithiobacillus ferriphilus]